MHGLASLQHKHEGCRNARENGERGIGRCFSSSSPPHMLQEGDGDGEHVPRRLDEQPRHERLDDQPRHERLDEQLRHVRLGEQLRHVRLDEQLRHVPHEHGVVQWLG